MMVESIIDSEGVADAHLNGATQSADGGAGPWFGHPRQLARLFSTEAMERFGFYGLRALLVLYVVHHFGFSDAVAGQLYGGMLALTYLTPFIGGLLADRYLGFKRAVKFGALVMSFGYLLLCFGGAPAQPFASIDGAKYPISETHHGKDFSQKIVINGQPLTLKFNDDKSVSLRDGFNHEVRRVAPASFGSGADRDQHFVWLALLGLALVTAGTGFFKPNISTIVGGLYGPHDRRRDAGFSIFYMGINLGALFSQVLCPLLATGMGDWGGIGWWAGFGLAAVGMLIAWLLFQFSDPLLAGFGEPPKREGYDPTILIYVGTIGATVVAWLLLRGVMSSAEVTPGAGITGYLAALPLLAKLLFALFIVAVPSILIWSMRTGTTEEFHMMFAAMILIVFNISFWTLFEQAGSSLTLFAERNTNLSVFGWFSITPAQTQFFNSFFIVLFAPLFSVMWLALGKRGWEPGIPVKFALGIIGAGLGFWFLVWGAHFVGPDYQVGLWWLVGLYLIQTWAELSLSPVGLSMITKLSMPRIVGMMMGMWFLSIATAEYIAGIIAAATSVKTVGGQVTNIKLSLATYVDSFWNVGMFAIIMGVILLIVAIPMKKLMHGVS